MSSNRRGSFIGWTAPYKYQDTKSYYERAAERSANNNQTNPSLASKIASAWKDTLQNGLILPKNHVNIEDSGTNNWLHTRGEYGAGRTRFRSPNDPTTKTVNSSTKKSITLNFERAKSGTSLPRRVVDDGPLAYKSNVISPNATLEYQNSDLFGYYASHELDWEHIICENPTEVDNNKMIKLLTNLNLQHLASIFLTRGISYKGLQNMTYDHFKILGVVGDDQAKLSKALRFAKYMNRNKHTIAATDDEIKSEVESDDCPEEILSIQRHRPRFMISSRKWTDHYKGPYWAQNANEFLGGSHAIKPGHGDSITGMFWASTLRAKKGGHHYSTDFRKNYIRHEGVTLNSSHIDPSSLISSPPPKVRPKFNADMSLRDRRGTVHMTKVDAPWANVQGLDGNFRK